RPSSEKSFSAFALSLASILIVTFTLAINMPPYLCPKTLYHLNDMRANKSCAIYVQIVDLKLNFA
ncbi:MAG: hypothetical protein SOX24_00500, partial [Candidatus Enterosoma sp.]|nr:hypothetical protein [Candidatus Enterosoma sp.]